MRFFVNRKLKYGYLSQLYSFSIFSLLQLYYLQSYFPRRTLPSSTPSQPYHSPSLLLSISLLLNPIPPQPYLPSSLLSILNSPQPYCFAWCHLLLWANGVHLYVALLCLSINILKCCLMTVISSFRLDKNSVRIPPIDPNKEPNNWFKTHRIKLRRAEVTSHFLFFCGVDFCLFMLFLTFIQIFTKSS